VTTLLLALALGAPAPKTDAKPPAEEHPLIGEWVVESEVSSGKPIAKNGKPARATITSDRWKSKAVSEIECCLTVNAKKDPSQIDFWNPTQGDEEALTAKGIYKLEGDTLTVCYGLNGERPTKFDSLPKSRVYMMTLKRSKKDETPGERK
jgi:uncharacterized protein (TIGR03067 family)